MLGAVGPAWTRGEAEAPAGQRDMGGWQAAVYDAEQQQRLGVAIRRRGVVFAGEGC